jgi:uncharacterized membrane protein YkvA (DUF1232 family)
MREIDDEAASRYAAEQAENVTPDDVDHVIGEKKRVAELCERASPLHGVKDELNTMVELVEDSKMGRFYVPWRVIAIIVGVVLYVLFPLDLILDFIPVLGWTDDLAVITWGAYMVHEELQAYRNWKNKDE